MNGKTGPNGRADRLIDDEMEELVNEVVVCDERIVRLDSLV